MMGKKSALKLTVTIIHKCIYFTFKRNTVLFHDVVNDRMTSSVIIQQK